MLLPPAKPRELFLDAGEPLIPVEPLELLLARELGGPAPAPRRVALPVDLHNALHGPQGLKLLLVLEPFELALQAAYIGPIHVAGIVEAVDLLLQLGGRLLLQDIVRLPLAEEPLDLQLPKDLILPPRCQSEGIVRLRGGG